MFESFLIFSLLLGVGVSNPLESGWFIRRASELGTGDVVSSPGFVFSSEEWLPAVVPGTVLTNLVKNGVYPDPYFDRNLESIPDISEVGPEFYTFFYFNKFELQPTSGRTWLNLRGINYRVEVFLNGDRIRPLEREVVEGMFIRYTFDISDLVGASNQLVILAHPPDHPGAPGGQGGDHEIGKNAASMQFSAGWDWIQATPDRNTGLWDKATITHSSDDILIRYPHIVTDVDTDDQIATLKVTTNLYNGGETSVSGILSYEVFGHADPVLLEMDVVIPPGPGSTLFRFLPTDLIQPRLWWPIGYGEPFLHTLVMTFCVHNSDNCEVEHIRFGVRAFGTDIDQHTNGRVFYVNDKLVFLRGSNWIATDQLLRFSGSAERYYNEVRMHAEMGMNLIRIWGGGIAERPEFFDACDELGVMVMQDFWMTGDVNGRWAGEYDWPLDHVLYNDALRDTIYMLRNHASLLFYAGGNELDDPHKSPPPDIQSFITEILSDPDGDPTRFYIQSTMNSYGNDYALARADGPYGIQNPRNFYNPLPVGGVAFNPEIGNIGMTVVESLHQTLSAEALDAFPTQFDTTVHPSWDFHTYISYTDTNRLDQIYNYGAPVNISEYSFRAQLVNYNQYRALFEGHMSRMYDIYTGVLIWKSHNPWSGLRGNLYDWFLDQTGSYFGIRHSLESVHVQFDLRTLSVDVINIPHVDVHDLSTRTSVYSFEGELLSESHSGSFNVSGHSHHKGSGLTWPAGLASNEVVFLRLELESSDQEVISQNDYWFSDWREMTQDMSFLTAYRDDKPPVVLETELDIQIVGCNWIYTLMIHNPQNALAFGIRFRLLKAIQKEQSESAETRVLPVWYSDNYVSFLPYEKRTIDIEFKISDAGEGVPDLWMEGWNVRDTMVTSG